jgi:hypothetical protein
VLNDRREEQKIIEVVQALILAPGTALFPRLSHALDHLRDNRSSGGTVCCPILSFRAESMSSTFRQRRPSRLPITT